MCTALPLRFSQSNTRSRKQFHCRQKPKGDGSTGIRRQKHSRQKHCSNCCLTPRRMFYSWWYQHKANTTSQLACPNALSLSLKVSQSIKYRKLSVQTVGNRNSGSRMRKQWQAVVHNNLHSLVLDELITAAILRPCNFDNTNLQQNMLMQAE